MEEVKSSDVLTVIPARSGSKRLPMKNIMQLAGLPLIGYSIKAGIGSRFVGKIIVSTDSQEISDISQKLGVQVPYLRPEDLSGDNASIFDVVQHVIQSEKKLGNEYKYILLLQPTSPLRTSDHVDESFERLTNKKAKGIISVTELEHPFEWVNSVPPSGEMDKFLNKKLQVTRSQDLTTRYRLNGAIYLAETASFLNAKSFFLEDNVYTYEMDRFSSVDIDTDEDFYLADLLMKDIQSSDK